MPGREAGVVSNERHKMLLEVKNQLEHAKEMLAACELSPQVCSNQLTLLKFCLFFTFYIRDGSQRGSMFLWMAYGEGAFKGK